MVQEKTHEIQQVLQDVRQTIAQNLTVIADKIISKANDKDAPSVPHAKFLLELYDWRNPVAAAKKPKPERADADAEEDEDDNGQDSAAGLMLARLEEIVREAEARSQQLAGAVK